MDNNNQAAFMGALNSLKEYAKVNGNIVTKQDVESYFKDLGLDEDTYSISIPLIFLPMILQSRVRTVLTMNSLTCLRNLL